MEVIFLKGEFLVLLLIYLAYYMYAYNIGNKVTQQLPLTSDEFELEFSGSSEPELWRIRAESSRAEALQFPSWNRADTMYINK